MKFCYLDESGYGDEPILVIAGIVVDAKRMHKTKKEWSDLILTLADKLNRPVNEFKTRKFYRGNGIWRDLNGSERSEFIKAVIDWLKVRKHDIAFSAVEKKKLGELQWHRHPDIKKEEIITPWKACALHLMLSIQKAFQNEKHKKGQTVMIFDREVKEEQPLIELVCCPPMWTDTFYDKGRTQERLDMVVDVPYFADSKAVGLLQLADLYAYLLRHYAELSQGLTKEEYTDELNKVKGWAQAFAPYTLKDSMRWPARGACDCANFYNEIAPDSLKNFVRGAN
jgi:hypothetical protein